jgi:hypothetical protein
MASVLTRLQTIGRGFGDKKTIKTDDVHAAAEETKAAAGKSKNTLSSVGWGDRLRYVVENKTAEDGNYPFYLLTYVTTLTLLAFGLVWWYASNRYDGYVYGQENYADAFFAGMQLIVSQGYVDEIPDKYGLRWFYWLMIFFGVVIFAVLVGFITDAIAQSMDAIKEGHTAVAEAGHTLILGWNEATLRAVVQISFLRRQYQQLNERKCFGLLWYAKWLTPAFSMLGLLERPSTSIAVANIVVMTDTLSKDEMHRRLEQVLAERGINPRRTKIGRNIICRVGDPTNVNDLIRVGAHRAAAILVMMTAQDEKEEDESEGSIQNGATLRAVLALRHVFFTNPWDRTREVNPDLRVVLQMSNKSEYVDAAMFQHNNGNPVIIPMDLTLFMNSLMFKCAAQPGLSSILLNIIDFEGTAIRRRKAKNLRSGPNNKYGDCIGKTFGEMRKQFTRAVFIGIIKPGMPVEEIASSGYGLCPDQSTVIDPEDLLIFIGPRSNPIHDYKMTATFDGYLKTAKALADANPSIESNRRKRQMVSKMLSNVLVCGWRPDWQDDYRRLHDRMMEIVRQRQPGSTITFVNAVDEDEFAALVLKMGLRKARDDGEVRCYEMHHPYRGIFIRHVRGDAAKPNVIGPIIEGSTIHTAIILGTQANIRLGHRHRDTRVLNIVLLLRKLWSVKAEGVPMHIVGENQEDMTSRLALAPKRGPGAAGGHEPDFVNSQAVAARALVQTLAYPIISPAVKDLFNEAEDSADIVTTFASEYVPLNVEMKFGVVRASVLRAQGERSICIGILWSNGDPALLPPHDSDVKFCDTDRLVVLRRLFDAANPEQPPKPSGDEPGSPLGRMMSIAGVRA